MKWIYDHNHFNHWFVEHIYIHHHKNGFEIAEINNLNHDFNEPTNNHFINNKHEHIIISCDFKQPLEPTDPQKMPSAITQAMPGF